MGINELGSLCVLQRLVDDLSERVCDLVPPSQIGGKHQVIRFP
jgi:hypothetical protein